MDFLPNGLATGVGSLSFSDPPQAVKMIFKQFPNLPWWPQISHEKPILSTWIGAVDRSRIRDGKLVLDCTIDDAAKVLEEHFDSSKAPQPLNVEVGYQYFFQHVTSHQSIKKKIVKGQVFSPLLLATMIEDNQGRELLKNTAAVEVLCHYISTICFKQARLMREFGGIPLIVIDDPILGQVSSTMISGPFNDLIKALQVEMRVGIHCCAVADWTEIMALDVDYVSFDMFTYLDDMLRHKKALYCHITKGGVVALGIVPTFPFDLPLDNDKLLVYLKAGIDKLRGRLSYEEFKSKMILTPSCGTAKHTLEKQQEIHDCLLSLSSMI